MAPKNQTSGEGINYEVFLPALVGLRLCIDDDVLDFEMKMNKNPGGNDSSKFDDITLKIETKSDGILYFGIQTKHKGKDCKNVSRDSFISGREALDAKGDFLLQMYCKSSFCDKVTDCITAKCLTPNSCGIIHCDTGPACTLPHRKIVQIHRKENKINYILYTNAGFDSQKKSKKVFEFGMTKHTTCKGSKFFATGGEIYKFETSANTIETEHVWKEDYDMFFSNFSLYVGQKNAKEIEKQIESEFQTHFGVKQQVANYINFVRHCHDDMYTDRKINKKMIQIQLLELLLPIEKLAFSPQLKFFEEMTKNVNITVIDEEYSSVCQNYCTSDWKYNIHTTKYGKSEILEQGQRKNIIERKIPSLDTDCIVKTLLYHYEYPIIISYENNSIVEKVIKLCGLVNNLHFVLIGTNITTQFPGATIFRNLSQQQLNVNYYNELKIVLRRDISIDLTSLIASGDTLLLQYVSVANMLQMFTKRYHLPETTRSEGYFPRKIKPDIRDTEIFNRFNEENYLVSGVSGSGKTELLKYLTTNWDSDHYTVYVNLKDKQCDPNSNVINNFLDIDSSQDSILNKLKEKLRDKLQIIFFFDALDEVFDMRESIECLKKIEDAGFKFWVAARTSITKGLKQELSSLRCLEMKDFEKNTREDYIIWRMKILRYDTTAKDATIGKIDTVGMTRQENKHLVAVPFYLDRLIDIFNDNENLDLRDRFVVTDIYRLFTDGNFIHYLKKQDSNLILKDFPALHFLKDYFWQQYEKTAIESCFGYVLTIRHSDDSYYKNFLRYIENRKEDPLGIVCTREDGSLEFTHRNYAEYFVALWISKNFHSCNFKNVIGGEQNANIRYFLDLELTARHPLFLAILHKDNGGIEANAADIDVLEDRSRRNVLHLACSQMPGSQGREETILEEILKRIDNPKKLNKRDELYGLTPVQYCEVFNFPTYAAILRKYDFSLKEQTIHKILDYAIFKNSPSHLRELIDDESDELQLQIQNYFNTNQNCLLKSVCNNYFDIVCLLLQTRVGLNFQDDMGKTPLYYSITKGLDVIFGLLIAAGAENDLFYDNFNTLQLSVACGRLDMCRYLVNTCGIPINVTRNGFAALHVAILNHQTDVLEFLVNELNANVDALCHFEGNLQDDHIALDILGARWEQIKSDEPRSALDLAIDCGFLDCVEFLVQKNAKSLKYDFYDLKLEAIA